jgi:hypothetical protein
MAKLQSIAMLIACLFFSVLLPAQDSINLADKILSFPTRFLDKVSKITSHLEDNIFNKSGQTLKQLSKQERRLQKKVYRKDSLLAKQLFQDTQQQYQSLQSKLKDKTGKITGRLEYIPLLDTLTTSIHFLEKSSAFKDNKLIEQSLGNIKGMETRFQQADQIQQYLRNRRQYLKEQLGKIGLANELKKYNKQLWYYQAQMQEYKSLLKQSQKIERKALDLLSKTKPFQNFMRKYSLLATMFPMPDNSDNAVNMASLSGLQSRAQVNSLIQTTIASGGPNALQQIQQTIGNAQSQLTDLKNKLASNSYSNGDAQIEIPDFKVNTQRLKSFWNRWELGTNVQSTRSNNWLPATTQLGLSAGFKINDGATIGLGVAGNIGWGKDIRHMALTYEGVGGRSYFDWKLKGSFWLSAGYEMNYRPTLLNIEITSPTGGGREGAAWQRSGLVGISKKYKVGKKFKSNMSLLWDCLSYSQVPRTQPILFRVGYSIK